MGWNVVSLKRYFSLNNLSVQYYKVLLQYYSILQSITPVLLYSNTTLYYKVLLHYYSVLPNLLQLLLQIPFNTTK